MKMKYWYIWYRTQEMLGIVDAFAGSFSSVLMVSFPMLLDKPVSIIFLPLHILERNIILRINGTAFYRAAALRVIQQTVLKQ